MSLIRLYTKEGEDEDRMLLSYASDVIPNIGEVIINDCPDYKMYEVTGKHHIIRDRKLNVVSLISREVVV